MKSVSLPFTQGDVDRLTHSATSALDTILDKRGELHTKAVWKAGEARKSNKDKQLGAISLLKDRPTWREVASWPVREVITAFEKSVAMPTDERVLMFDCVDPEFLLFGEVGGTWSLTKAHEWYRMPEDGYFQVSGCGVCRTCLGKDTAGAVGLGRVVFHHYGPSRVHLVTRTFASHIVSFQDVCLHLDNSFRNALKQEAKRNRIPLEFVTAHEFGGQMGRRHFHDYICGPTLAELEALLRLTWHRTRGGDVVSVAERYWPYGLIHVQPIDDPNGAGYAFKYANKARALRFVVDEHSKAQVARIRAQGNEILRSYMKWTRPAFGNVALQNLVDGQWERIRDEAVSVYSKERSGLRIPESEFGPEQTIALRRADRERVAAMVSRRLGHELTWTEIFPSSSEDQLYAIRDALDLYPTEMEVDP